MRRTHIWRFYVCLRDIQRAWVRFVSVTFFEATFYVEIGRAVQTLQMFALAAVGLEFLEFLAGAAVFAAVAGVATAEEFESTSGVGELAYGQGGLNAADLLVERVGEIVGRLFLENGGVGHFGHAEAPIAAAIPVGYGDGFDYAFLDEADGLQGLAVVVEEFEEFFGALGGERDGVGKQLPFFLVPGGAGLTFRRAGPCGEGGVRGGDAFAVGRDRSAGFGAVQASCVDLFWRSHSFQMST